MTDSLPTDRPDDTEDDGLLNDLERDQLKIDDLRLDELEPDEDVDEFADAYVSPPDAADAPAETADADAPVVGFFDAGPDSHALDDLTLVGRPSVLERLGPAHFRSKGFSFMGFLQTVYDHVAGELAANPTAATPGPYPAAPAESAPSDPTLTPDAPSPEAPSPDISAPEIPPPADPQA